MTQKTIRNDANANPPIVLSFSSLDPSGSGGIQADIETAASLGCHCAPVVTSLCASSTHNIRAISSVSTPTIIEQARSVIDEMDVRAFKIGFVGSRSNAEAIHSILLENQHLPIVSCPALSLRDNTNREHIDIDEAYSNLILPLSDLAIFSLPEARSISRESDTIETTAHTIVATGCDVILITGTGTRNQEFQNRAFNAKGLIKEYYWDHASDECHGACATLAMSAASYLAHGFNDIQTLEQAQHFTCQSMQAARILGFDQKTPHRFYWADKNIETSAKKLCEKNTH